MIELHNKRFEPFISEEAIIESVQEIAEKINTHFSKNNKVHLLPILNGAFMFCSDLCKQLNMSPQLSFAKVSSYSGTQSTGKIKDLIGVDVEEIKGKDVIIIEDIVDTGHTINYLKKELISKGANSVSVACLIFKPAAYLYDELPDFIGISIETIFIVGYGMDYDGLGRALPEIYKEK